MDLLAKNKKWLFSGIGVVVIPIAYSIIFGGKKQPEITNIINNYNNYGYRIEILNKSPNETSTHWEKTYLPLIPRFIL